MQSALELQNIDYANRIQQMNIANRRESGLSDAAANKPSTGATLLAAGCLCFRRLAAPMLPQPGRKPQRKQVSHAPLFLLAPIARPLQGVRVRRTAGHQYPRRPAACQAIQQAGGAVVGLLDRYNELTDTRNLVEAENEMRKATQDFNAWRLDPTNADESQWLPKWEETQAAVQKKFDGLKLRIALARARSCLLGSGPMGRPSACKATCSNRAHDAPARRCNCASSRRSIRATTLL